MNYIDRVLAYDKLAADARDYPDLFSNCEGEIIPRCDEPQNNAIIILGFSGNGKSTIIKKFLELHPEYQVISIDKIFREFVDKYHGMPQLYTLQSEFGRNIKMHLGKPLIFDGNFLNLLNRLSLCDYLHENGYNVNLVDMRGILGDTLLNRIFDETSKMLAKDGIVSPSEEEYLMYFHEASRNVENYYQEERKRAFIDQQEQYGTIHWGADRVFEPTRDLEELASIGQARK